MHEALWAGIARKLDNAEFHPDMMARSLAPPERTQANVAARSAGSVVGGLWQRPFYAHLDAFLSATHSLGEIVNFSFGYEKYGPRQIHVLISLTLRIMACLIMFSPQAPGTSLSSLCLRVFVV